MDTSTGLAETLQRFSQRYRAALTTKAGLLAGLGVGVASALGWRLQLLQVPWALCLGVPVGIGVLAVSGVAWWLRRRWISPSSSAAYLDQTLGLQQRLVTAAEFAQAPQPPALYPLLIEDTARQCSPEHAKLPRPVNRVTALLALILLLLLLWPVAGRSPLMQLAQLPQTVPPPRPPEQPTPPPQPQSREQQQQQQQQGGGSSDQQQAGGGSGTPKSDQQKSGSGGESQPQEQRDGESGQAGKSGQGSSNQSNQAQSGRDQRSGQGTEEQRGGEQQGQRGSQEQTSGSQGQQHQGQAEQAAGAKGQNQSSGATGQQQQPQAGTQQGDQRSGSQQGSRAEQRPGSGGGQLSSGDQQALKAEIQQLLKEVSGELKELQAQLETAKDQSPPPAGTSTDPNLYESPAPLDPSKGDALPIQLQADQAPTKSPRPGGGVGTASKEVSKEGPSMKAEDAQLSDTPIDETPANRQVVPPEYRDVFDRLNRTTNGITNDQAPNTI